METLTAAECRVLGCLIEKEATVPDTYPMTLNALRSACNQKSSRDPTTAYAEAEVIEAADGLRGRHLTRLVHQPGGRAAKHKHRADEELLLDEPALAVLSVLLLRGPQTVGELRTRTERQFAFDSTDEVGHALERLSSRDEPLVRILPRQPGQKDQRWIHLLGDEPDGENGNVGGAADSDLGERVARLEALVSSLCEQLGVDPDLPGAGDAG